MIVITRHAPLVEYLHEIGIIDDTARVIAHAAPDDVRGQHVIGVLPLSLAALCASVTDVPLSLTMDDRAAMQRGDLPIDRLREIAGAPVTYIVTVQVPA